MIEKSLERGTSGLGSEPPIAVPAPNVSFRLHARNAYGYRCAMSGLQLLNGGGRPEVLAAHIKPIEMDDTNSVRNGLALSGTLHWMFDRGLISVAEDGETILVSRNKVPGDVVGRLLLPDGKLFRPDDPKNIPHPENLHWHHENVFGNVCVPTAWGGFRISRASRGL